MPRPDKTVEPSMEEILASIRKIISEEPIGTRPAASDARAPADALGRYEPGAEPSLADLGSAVSPREERSADTAALEAMLDLAKPVPGEAADASAIDKRWTFANPAGAQPRPSPSSSMDAGTPAATEAVGGAASETARSTFTQVPRNLNGAAAAGATEAKGTPSSAVDADAALSAARAKIERHLGRPAHASIERPLVPGLKSIRDADFRGRQEAPARPAAGGLMARMAAAAGASQPEPAAAKSEGAAQGIPAGSSADPGAPAAAAPKMAEDAAGAGKEATAETANGAQPAPAAAPGKASPVESVSGTAAKAASSSSDRVRTFEDAVAEMLRPMLREWLDANLARLVQQALTEEMAKSSLPGRDKPTG